MHKSNNIQYHYYNKYVLIQQQFFRCLLALTKYFSHYISAIITLHLFREKVLAKLPNPGNS